MDPAHPQAGERERGILLPTASADIPYVVFTAHVQVPLALVSSSQLFKQAEFERGRASKAQLSRLGDMFQHGTEVGFQPVNIEGRTVATSIQYTCKPTEVVLRDFGVVSVKDFVVINPVGRLLFSSLYHFVGCPPELCDPLLADVVYEAKLLIRVDLEGCAGDPSKLPNAKLTAIVQELWVPTEEEVTTFDLAPWRTCSIVRYLGDDFDPGVLPQPRSTLPGIHLLYLGANRALYIDRPRYKVLIPKPGGLKPGRELKAAAFWSSRNDAYIVYDFGLKGRDVSMMPAFIELNPFADELQCEETRFHVRVRQANAFKSPAFRGFYMAVKERKPTEALLSEKLLIEDPLHLLIDQQLPTGGLRVGIRPNKDYNRVAKFSISRVVDEAGGKLSRPKRRGDLTIATGSGFLANRVTGSVYCSQFPLVPLYLPVPDRSQLRVGEQITFKAAYCDEKRIYVIIQWQRAVEVESQTFEPYRDGHLFIETLKETRLGCSDRCCLGENFGLITDRDEVILTYAKRNKVGMPKDVPVRVRENRDPNRSTFFDVHSVTIASLQEQMEEFEEQFTPLPSLIDSTRLKEIGEIHAQLVKLLDEDEGATKTDSK